MAQTREFGIVKSKFLTEHRTLEQRKSLRRGEAGAHGFQQAQKRVDRGTVAARLAVGDAVGDAQRGVFRAAEDGVNERRVALDLGRHHEDVARLERRVFGKQRQQLIVEHLHLAHRRMADVQLQRGVVRRDALRLFAGQRAPALRVQDVALEPMQQAAPGGLKKRFRGVHDAVPRALVGFEQDVRKLRVEFA